MTPQTAPSLLPFDPETNSIPQFLRQQKRWAPWKGIWNAKRKKWDKIPLDIKNPSRRMSTAAPERWFSYADALAALRQHPGHYSGIGFVMTGMKGLVGFDGDKCVDRSTGAIQSWAHAVINTVDSYAEISPSGTGVRVFALGEVPQDFTNHKVGVEIYQGDHPRFLTVTGHRIEGAARDVMPAAPGSLTWLDTTYRLNPLKERAESGEKDPRPLILTPAEVPHLDTLELPFASRDFLTYGKACLEPGADGSLALLSASYALFKAGLTDTQIFSFLVSNQHAMELALDHRSHKQDKAEQYIWDHMVTHVRDDLAKKGSLLKLEDFDLSAAEDAEYEEHEALVKASLEGTPVADNIAPETVGNKGGSDVEFEAVTDEQVAELPEVKPAKAKHKFKVHSALGFSHATLKHKWLIDGILPKAEVATVYGPSGSGKTFFVLDMLMHMALGRMWCGHAVPRRSHIVYIAAEGANGLRLRIRAACDRMGVLEGDFPLMVIDGAPNMLDKEDVKALVSSIKGQCGDVDLVVTDTLSQVTPGANENSSEDMGRALAHLKLVGKALKAMLLLVGHTGKDTSRGQRGWSGLKGAMDVEFEVLRLATFRTATITKMKDGEHEGKEFIFDLTKVNLDVMVEEDELIGPELKGVTTCVVDFQLDPSVVALMKEDEAKAQAKARTEKREEKKDALEKHGMTGGAKYLRDVLEAYWLAGRKEPTFQQVRAKFAEAFGADHPNDTKGEAMRASWKRQVTEGRMSKYAKLGEDERFHLLKPPGEEPAPDLTDG